MNDLPDALVASIASYLACPARAIFAVALEGLPGPRDAVVASCDDWSTLDFGELEARVAGKLSDDDMANLLVAIGDARKVKTLRLKGCTGITGAGLAPLSGSAVLEVVDLAAGLSGGEDDELHSNVAVPIITSIIDVWIDVRRVEDFRVAAVKRCIDIPSSWAAEIKICNSPVARFMAKYKPFFTTEVPYPRRPMNSYMLYANATRGAVRAANPDATVGVIGKIMGQNYKSLPQAERTHWDQIAADGKERYKKELEDYARRKRLKLREWDEFITCEKCLDELSFDKNAEDENARKSLPVLSKTCGHSFCHWCILGEQERVASDAEDEASPNWIACMECRKADEFCPSKPKYDWRLIDILSRYHS